MIDRHTAEHYQWGDGCDGWHLVRTPSLSVIEERMPPGTQATRHYHRAATQFFYVLEGWLSIEVEGREHEVSAAQGGSSGCGTGAPGAEQVRGGWCVSGDLESAGPGRPDASVSEKTARERTMSV